MPTVTPELTNLREQLPPIWGLTVKQEWLIEDLLPENAVIMLTGESGGGKSTVALAIAQAVSTGEDFIGRPTQKRPVLVVDKENGVNIYHERLKRLNVPPNPDLLFWGNWTDWEPQGPANMTIRRFVQQETPKPLIIFDSFIAFHPGSEQAAEETRAYMDGFRILQGQGATVLVIHHTGKGLNTKEYRGSSDIKASLDVGITLTAKAPLLKKLQLKPFKNREGILDPIMITMEGDRFQEMDMHYVPSNDADWTAVLEYVHLNPGKNQKDIYTALPGIPLQKVRRILMAATQTGALTTTKGLRNSSLYHWGAQNPQ